ncbi:hypothetical protein, partial [Fulvivirga kasyanovii]
MSLFHANAGFRIAGRGTVQNDILEDDEVGFYLDGTNLKIKVNCKEDAGGLKQQMVKYSLAVTLEVTEMSLYQSIKNLISEFRP